MSHRFSSRWLLLAACLCVGLNHANEWPNGPATLANQPAAKDTAWELTSFRRILPVLEDMAAATDSKALDKPLRTVFWDPTLAQQLNDKTNSGPRITKIKETRDGLAIEASIGEVSTRTLSVQIPLSFRLKLDEAQRTKALNAYRDRLLSIALSTVVTGISQNDEDDLILKTRDAVAILRHDGTAISPQLPTLLSYHKPSGHKELATITTTSELIIEGEDFDGVRVFSDWEPTEKGWYGRTIKQAHTVLTYSQDTVVVAHEVAISKPLTKTLTEPLPAGRYEILLDVSYHRTRIDDNIITVDLGGRKHRFSWFLPAYYYGVGKETGLIRGPIFTLDVPTSTISLTPVQLGGGGLNEIPTFQKRFIIIDRVLIRGL